jgi:hypothetical protein
MYINFHTYLKNNIGTDTEEFITTVSPNMDIYGEILPSVYSMLSINRTI